MSVRHPIVAITGSSGAGTTSVTRTFESIFRREGVAAAVIEGDSFHRYDRAEMKRAAAEIDPKEKPHFSHFGEEANLFDELETLFRTYSETGTGRSRKYLHNDEEAAPWDQPAGTFTPWSDLPPSELLFYEGLHGGVVTEDNNVAQHVDLLIGMVPIVNLEWIQKIIRDTSERGHSREAVQASIVRSMDDYINHITPQFSRTHINFQRVPTVDTSNPFSAKDIPSLDESFVVIRFRGIKHVDFPYYLQMINGSFMSRVNTLVVPGGKMGLAMELILTPLIEELMIKRRQARGQVDWLGT